MKEIFIPNSGVVTFVDDLDVDLALSLTWHVHKGYLRSAIGARPFLHNLIAQRINISLIEPDHIDRNKLNNQRNNLRVATRLQQVQNIGLRATNTSGFIGIDYRWDRNKYVVRITINGKRKHLGQFESLNDAVKCRDEAVCKYHGDFGVLNLSQKEKSSG